MNIRTLVGNGILAALYIAVSMLIQPFGFTNVQFRISEMFNHLVVFNKKAIYGIVLGVFLTNLFFSPMINLRFSIWSRAIYSCISCNHYFYAIH